METTAISHIGEKAGATATVQGWLYNKRSSGKIQFLIVRDGTGYLQCVVAEGGRRARRSGRRPRRRRRRARCAVTGTVREDKRAPGGYEMTATAVEILGASEDYPITPKEHGVDFLMNLRHLWMRSSQQHAVLRVRSEIEQAIRDFFYEREFVLHRLADPDAAPPSRGRRRSSRPTTSARRRTSRSPGSSTSSPRPRRSARSTASARRSARRSRRRAGT